jgi:hypothetical protein
LQVYDDFGKAGYSLAGYHEKWMTPDGLGEMAAEDTRGFSGGRFHVSAVPSGRGAAGRARLFGQGAGGSFGNFTTLTITGPAGRSDIVSALVAARG